LAVGNSLEIIEAVNTLKGNGPKDFVELCMSAAKIMLVQAKITQTEDEAEKLLISKIESGEALEKLKEFVKAQGGDVSYIENTEKFPKASIIYPIYSEKEGYINKIDALGIGTYAMKLGAGRAVMSDIIDYSAGIVLNKKIGDYVSKGEVLCYIHTNKSNYLEIIDGLVELFTVLPTKSDTHKIIYEIIS
jgi:pyrimidine-nucleoside phosphorylase